MKKLLTAFAAAALTFAALADFVLTPPTGATTAVPPMGWQGTVVPNGNLLGGVGATYFQSSNSFWFEWIKTNSTGNTNWTLVMVTQNGYAITNSAGQGISATVFVSTNGNDSTVVPGNQSYPALTVAKANSLAFPGGTVIFEPANWTNNNLLTNGVNYYAMPGANFYWQANSTNNPDDYWGFIDDRPCGPTTNYFSAPASSFIWQGYTNIISNANQHTGTNSFANICATNPGTRIFVDCGSIQRSSWIDTGNDEGPGGAAIGLRFGARLTVKCRSMFDPYAGSPLTFTNSGTPPHTKSISSNPSGVYWEGNCWGYVDCTSNSFGYDHNQYGLWGVGDTTNETSSFYYTGQYLGGKTYVTAGSTNFLWWVTVPDIELLSNSSPTLGQPFTLDGTQRGYITAQKIAPAPNAGALAVVETPLGFLNTSNPMVKLSTIVLAGSNIWFNSVLGATWANVTQLEDASGSCSNLSTAGLFLGGMRQTNKYACFYPTNMILAGGYWTNTTGVAGVLNINHGTTSTASVAVTNLSSGEWNVATNGCPITLFVSQNEIIEDTNLTGSPTLNNSWFRPGP